MSRYSGIKQLLEEMGASDRSADDPWTISRTSHGATRQDSFTPAVVADLGAPPQDLTSEIQASEQIARADEIVTSPTGLSAGSSSSSSGGSGILGGFLSLFPLASAVGKLFGLGGKSSPPPLTPYIQPPSINFEGAMSASLSGSTTASLPGSGSTPHAAPGVNSLSYGADGLPRAAEEQSAPVAKAATPVVGQLNSLTSASFAPEPASNSPFRSSDFADITNSQAPPATFSSGSSNGNPDTTASSSQSGQSILVQVQAMDSQSFMDHSNDIAQAVRQAMLNMHSVNDVIADL